MRVTTFHSLGRQAGRALQKRVCVCNPSGMCPNNLQHALQCVMCLHQHAGPRRQVCANNKADKQAGVLCAPRACQPCHAILFNLANARRAWLMVSLFSAFFFAPSRMALSRLHAASHGAAISRLSSGGPMVSCCECARCSCQCTCWRASSQQTEAVLGGLHKAWGCVLISTTLLRLCWSV